MSAAHLRGAEPVPRRVKVEARTEDNSLDHVVILVLALPETLELSFGASV